MGWEKWAQQNGERVMKAPSLRESFYIFTLTLLSLLLPLSFLLLARLSIAQSLLTLTPYPSSPASFLLSLFLFTNPTLLHVLVSLVSVTALLHGLTGRVALFSGSSSLNPVPRLYTTWIFLCALQVCVGLGIEGTIAAGIWPENYGVGNENSFLSRIIFFVGLHETMLHWSRAFVRPVVDDTVFGVERDERWVEKVTMGASFGALWWWRLRDEIDGLLFVWESNRELFMGLGIADLFSWWLYYLTVAIGMVKLVRGLIWLGKVPFCRKVEGNPGCNCGDDDKV